MVFSDLLTTPAAGRTPLLWLVTIPLCTPIIGIRSPKRAAETSHVRFGPDGNPMGAIREPQAPARQGTKWDGEVVPEIRRIVTHRMVGHSALSPDTKRRS